MKPRSIPRALALGTAVLALTAAIPRPARAQETPAGRDTTPAASPDTTAAANRDATPPAPGREEVLDVIDAFHRALAAGDSAAALALLDPGVTIYESGHAEDLDQYRSGHLATDMEFAGAVESRVVDEWVGMSDRHAIVGRIYGSKGSFREREVDAVTTETVFLLRGDDETWRIRHLHWSSRRASPTSDR